MGKGSSKGGRPLLVKKSKYSIEKLLQGERLFDGEEKSLSLSS